MKNELKIWLNYMHKKVILPLKRQHKDSHYLARSLAMGLGWAFAPFPGQVPVVFFIWIVARKLRYRFSLAISIALTFISNVFTNIPLFYLYYITGNYIRGDRNKITYHQLNKIFDDGTLNGMKFIATEFGLNILIGSLIYMTIFAILGYLLGLFISKKNKI